MPFGQVGYVLGSFLTSGIHRDVVMAMLDRSIEWWSMLLPFGMMVVGVIIECVFAHITSRKYCQDILQAEVEHFF